MKKQYYLSIISVLILVVFVIIAIGSGDTTEPERVEREEADSIPVEEPIDETEAANETFYLGDTVKMGDLIFTLNSIRWDQGSEFMKPDPGEKWIVFDCTIENAGDSATNISSLAMFSLYDEEHYSCSMTIFADTKGSLDGELGAGRKMRGEIAFDVEEGQSKWEFIFKPEMFGFGQAIFEITDADVN